MTREGWARLAMLLLVVDLALAVTITYLLVLHAPKETAVPITINVNGLQWAFDDAEPLTNGTVILEPWAGDRPYIDVDGPDITFPSELHVPLVNGVLARPITFTPPPADLACLHVRVEDNDRRRALDRWVAVPTSESIDYADLVDVDPQTYAPVDPTPTLIETIDQRVQTTIGAALDDYLAENPLEGATAEYVDDAIVNHANDPTPHPEYDDGPSLVLIFENGLI